MSYGIENERFVASIGVAPHILANATVVVELPASLAGRSDAAAAFVLAANLVARLFRRVHLVGPDAALGPHPWKIATTREALPILTALSEGAVAWDAYGGVADVAIGIGAAPSAAARKSVVVGFAPGVARIDREGATGPEDRLAALVAACFGAAQAFLHVAAASGATLGPNDPFAFTLPVRAPSDAVALGTVHIAGIGAIGSAVVYGLGHLACRGTLVPIDPDDVDGTNLQRYLLMISSDVGAAKVDVAARALDGGALVVKPFRGSYQTYKKEHASERIECLLTPVDSNVGRCELARSLPRRVVNASTSDRVITVSRHGFGDGRACLHCVYEERGRAMSTAERYAKDLGVGAGEVARLLAENAPVDAMFVARVEAHLSVPLGTHAAWIGRPLASFYQRAVCGSAAVATSAGIVVAPLGFISAAAGLLLLADLVGGCALGDESTRPNYLRLDMLKSPEHADRGDRLPDPGHACICKDPDYLETYREHCSG